MIKVGIIGATGYAGGELVRILTGHREAEIKWYGSRSYIDKKYADVYQNMFQIIDAVCMDDNMEELASQVDVIFTATPQGLCASLVNEEILSKTKIIDLSADFRLKDVKIYEEWYKLEHKSPQFIEEAVYGLCEVNREDPSRGESGMLYDLFHFDGISVGKRRADRYGHLDHRCKIRNVRSGKRSKTAESLLRSE